MALAVLEAHEELCMPSRPSSDVKGSCSAKESSSMRNIESRPVTSRWQKQFLASPSVIARSVVMVGESHGLSSDHGERKDLGGLMDLEKLAYLLSGIVLRGM